MKKVKSSTEVKKFDSFEDLRVEFGLPVLRRQTKDREKLAGQRERFLNRHKCPACEGELKLIEGTNVFYCPNKKCDGFTRTTVDEETGETLVLDQSIAFDLLDDKGAQIANNIFAELD